MSSELSATDRIFGLLSSVLNDVLSSAESMSGTIIAAGAFGGFCLLIYKVISYYRDSNPDLLSKEHGLAVTLIIMAFFALPLSGVIFSGLYGITNHIVAWQIGLTTPMIVESAYLAYANNAKKGAYHKQFMPEEDGA